MKWVGGKTKLLPRLLEHVPARFGRYYEPFAGGAALFFALAPSSSLVEAVLADVNEGLVNAYQSVANDVEAVITQLEHHARLHSPTHYYAVRREWNRGGYLPPDGWPTERAAAFLYLNRTCFNGLWRVNRHGEMNVPIGRYENPTICNPELLRAAAGVLAHTDLRCADYQIVLAEAERGDLVYLDPPYVPLTATAHFTSYSAAGFGPDDQADLAERVRELAGRGVHVIASNSDTPLVREIYAGLDLHAVSAPRAINSDASRRGDVIELIIVGRPTGRGRNCMARIQKQTNIPGTESTEPSVLEIDQALDSWLDAQADQKQAADTTKIRHASLQELMVEHELERYPYIDPVTGKKKHVFNETKQKLRLVNAPKPPRRHELYDEQDADETHGVDPDQPIDARPVAKTAKRKDHDKVEHRKVSRASVESEIDPFASTRRAMDGDEPSGVH